MGLPVGGQNPRGTGNIITQREAVNRLNAVFEFVPYAVPYPTETPTRVRASLLQIAQGIGTVTYEC